MKVIWNKILPIGRNYGAINLFGILFVKRGVRLTPELLNHERIHTAQMRELLYLPFYIVYVAEWLVRLVMNRGKGYEAYWRISFEREAYENDHNPEYLKTRRPMSQWRKQDR